MRKYCTGAQRKKETEAPKQDPVLPVEQSVVTDKDIVQSEEPVPLIEEESLSSKEDVQLLIENNTVLPVKIDVGNEEDDKNKQTYAITSSTESVLYSEALLETPQTIPIKGEHLQNDQPYGNISQHLDPCLPAEIPEDDETPSLDNHNLNTHLLILNQVKKPSFNRV